MNTRIKIVIQLGLLFLIILAICLTACTSKRLQKRIVKADSVSIAVNSYDRLTTIEEKAKDSIPNPVPGLSADFDGCDTNEQTFSTPLYDLSIKGGKKGSASVKPKKDAKVPVDIQKTTIVKETGSSKQHTETHKEVKQVENVKSKPAAIWGWVALAVVAVIVFWFLKKQYHGRF